MIRIQQLKMPLSHSKEALLKKACKLLRIKESDVLSWQIVRQSVDARHKPDLTYVYTLDLTVAAEKQIAKKIHNKNIMLTKATPYHFPEPGEQLLKQRPVIVGSGPAGMFCAYMLAQQGYQPLVIERGDDVDKRREKVEHFWSSGILDAQTNVQFGEGGAGTFSDGKLNTSVKDPQGRNHKVLELFVEAGAPAAILYQQKPHLGTDSLIEIMKNMRQKIIQMGGEFQFATQVTNVVIDNQQMIGIECNDGRYIDTQVLVCAIGHSARDTFAMLHKAGISMTEKAFAVGVRIEHPQTMINQSQYGQAEVRELGAANYKLTHQLSSGRGLYSFCMCPGGYVVNASSEDGHLAVNGMSYQKRDSRNANSAMIVTVSPDDYAAYAADIPKALTGIAFQRELEKAAYATGDGKIPVQLWGDFLTGNSSTTLGDVAPCIKGAWQLSNLRKCLPEFISTSLVEGIVALEQKITGFARYDCLISGVESRTSSPIRLHRDDHMEGNIRGFYPCGEGAGYAGGITSAAIDGLKTAEAIAHKYKF